MIPPAFPNARPGLAGLMLLLLLALTQPVSPGTARADGLMIDPKRIVFEDRERNAAVVLINRGAQAVTYRISFRDVRMREDGSFEPLDEVTPADRPAESLIRYSPRQVTLQPGEAQSVRLLLRKPGDLPAGEYRSHLLFRAIPTSPVPSAAATGGELSIHLQAQVGMSIPVIVRHGELDAQAVLSEARFERLPGGGIGASARLGRTGGRSLYGDIEVRDGSAAGPLLAVQRGIAVYTTTPSRVIRLALPEGYRAGPAHLVFRAPADAGGAVLAEATLQP